MRYSAAAVKASITLGIVLLLLAWSVPHITSVSAAETEVIVNVCGGPATGSSITINSPQNDSVISSAQLVVSGDVSNATQIDITIDGNYNGTLPLDAQATTYETTVSLSPGTHTIELVANDVCGQLNDSASVVVTYEPTVQPGTGSPGATIINSGGGVNVGAGGTVPSNNDAFPNNVPIIGPIVTAGQGLARALDLDTSGRRGGLIETLLRVSFVTAGLLLAVFSSLAIGWIISALKWLRLTFITPPLEKFSNRRSSFKLRIAGMFMFVAALLI